MVIAWAGQIASHNLHAVGNRDKLQEEVKSVQTNQCNALHHWDNDEGRALHGSEGREDPSRKDT